MPDQFTVPQFIDAEDKILGPISVRQFVIMMAAFVIEFIFFRFLPFVWFLVIGIPFFGATVTLAFAKINGQPFHYFLINIIQSIRKPNLRIWDKDKTDAELRQLMTVEKGDDAPPPPRKKAASASRLQELSLVVNTGGVYKPDEDVYGQEK